MRACLAFSMISNCAPCLQTKLAVRSIIACIFAVGGCGSKITSICIFLSSLWSVLKPQRECRRAAVPCPPALLSLATLLHNHFQLVEAYQRWKIKPVPLLPSCAFISFCRSSPISIFLPLHCSDPFRNNRQVAIKFTAHYMVNSGDITGRTALLYAKTSKLFQFARNEPLLFSQASLKNSRYIWSFPDPFTSGLRKNSEKTPEQKQPFGLMVLHIWNVSLDISVSLHSKNNCPFSTLSEIISQVILNTLSIRTGVISVKKRFKRLDRTQEFKKEHLKLSYYFRIISKTTLDLGKKKSIKHHKLLENWQKCRLS